MDLVANHSVLRIPVQMYNLMMRMPGSSSVKFSQRTSLRVTLLHALLIQNKSVNQRNTSRRSKR
jgi:hypothetical protein